MTGGPGRKREPSPRAQARARTWRALVEATRTERGFNPSWEDTPTPEDRYALVENGPWGAWLSTHPTPGAASEYNEKQECQGDWDPVVIIDLDLDTHLEVVTPTQVLDALAHLLTHGLANDGTWDGGADHLDAIAAEVARIRTIGDSPEPCNRDDCPIHG